MKRLKPIISLVLSLTIIVSILAFCIPSASAATIFTVDDVVYSIESNFEARVYGYNGTNPVVEIPEKIGSRVISGVESKAFFQNETVEEIILPPSVLTIGGWAFFGAKNLKSINIPVNLKSIGNFAFWECSSLNEINLSSSVTSIPVGAFYGSGITEIFIPFNITEIQRLTFQNCKNLTSVKLANSVTKINASAFDNCTSLTSITIPKMTTSIDATAFTNCPNLTIFGYFDSYAEEFAVANNIPFVPIIDYKLGDVDKDGEIAITDVTVIQKALAGTQVLTKEQNYLADVDKNGTVNIDDATIIQKYLAEIITSFE